MMGFGHIYMKKFIKGFMLFFVGGFLALMSLASIYLIFQPSQFSLEVNIVTAAIFSVPFLILLVWQLFDAPKPPRSIMRQDTYGNNRPPYGP
jgi:membrane protein implicated in regulation of membrane protease activity